MNKAILSTKYPQFANRLKKRGFTIIPSEIIPCKMPYERNHADLQCLILNDTAFVLSRCQQISNALSDDHDVISCGDTFSGEYPDNVCLNAVLLDHTLLCREPSLDKNVKEYCAEHGYELLHVNQGYTKCSCTVIADNAVITADIGISRVQKARNMDVLTIGQGSIRLDGAEYGFIGGAGGYHQTSKTWYVCGDIKYLPEYESIKYFCKKHHTNIVCLTDEPPVDIGGILFC